MNPALRTFLADGRKRKPYRHDMIAEKEESPLEPAGIGQSDRHVPPKDWKEALAALVSSRLEMILIEAKSASSAAAGRFILLAMGLFALLSAWVLAIAAAIAAIAARTTWEWFHVAFAFAAAHFLIGAVLLLIIIRSGKKASFPVTRAEFEKDREWLNRLKSK